MELYGRIGLMIFLSIKDEIKRYSTLSEKKELLNTLVDKVYVDWDDVTKTHNIKYSLNSIWLRIKVKELMITYMR